MRAAEGQRPDRRHRRRLSPRVGAIRRHRGAVPGRRLHRHRRRHPAHELRQADRHAIGWRTNGFQYEVGFANLAIGVAGVDASFQDTSQAWVAAALAGGVFLALAGAYHVVEIIRDRNDAPGNTVILISDFGIPISLLALLLSTGSL